MTSIDRHETFIRHAIALAAEARAGGNHVWLLGDVHLTKIWRFAAMSGSVRVRGWPNFASTWTGSQRSA